MGTTNATLTHVHIANLEVARPLYDFIAKEVVPGTGITPGQFWSALADIITALTPQNRTLLAHRDELQAQIDAWHRAQHSQAHDHNAYVAFLKHIGYLLDEESPCKIKPQHVDPEIACIAGPQLVVPINNARYALNAANARWGSLFDALYGTDAMGLGMPAAGGFDKARGAQVVAYALAFLDEAAPLTTGSHADVVHYRVRDQRLLAESYTGNTMELAEPDKFVGYRQHGDRLSAVLLRNHGLHIEIAMGQDPVLRELSRACITDVILEAALTTIQDCEDSVAAVDAEDKVLVYRNWLQLMQGTLHASFAKNGKTMERRLNPDRSYLAPDGSALTLPGRSLMLIRNVGLHMTTDAVLTAQGEEVYEGILDCMVSAFCALYDVHGHAPLRNSRSGSIYIVKPKLHGPAETAFTVDLFGRTEQALGLAPNTIKLGIMDEERRTTLNLPQCIRTAAERVIFINTGFLDRTGDEIHTSMEAGPMLRKEEMKQAPWLLAYEDWNVDTGLACGFAGRAQIGKGMWTKPERMLEMLQDKIRHPLAGASCAWVPSPTAATLHALHYHKVDVEQQQKKFLQREAVAHDVLLQIPVVTMPTWTAETVQAELDNNIQGILGYVVRWVEHGLGASKVPDINHIELMEDRATLRISSQHIANWLHHGIVSKQQVQDTLERMARIVDEQNAITPNYINIAPGYAGGAFNAARELIFHGRDSANGYTEDILRHWRRLHKAQQSDAN